MRYLIILVIANLSLEGNWVLAQQSQALDDQEVISVENLYKNSQTPAIAPKASEIISQQEQKEQHEINNNADVQNSKIKSLADLNKLAPFSDVSVIQKKFLPKTGRFQLYTAGGLATNSPWFINLGFKANLAYHFTESFGIEASSMLLSSSEGESAKEIRTNNSLQPDKFVIAKYNIGLDLIWSPIYGKISTLENEIIPFDMYFAFGAGMTGTNAQEPTVPTFHIGAGQIFAISKSMAFRWDYSWSFYQATPVADLASTSAPSKSNYNDLIFTAGVSFFFPEAGYR